MLKIPNELNLTSIELYFSKNDMIRVQTNNVYNIRYFNLQARVNKIILFCFIFDFCVCDLKNLWFNTMKNCLLYKYKYNIGIILCTLSLFYYIFAYSNIKVLEHKKKYKQRHKSEVQSTYYCFDIDLSFYSTYL